MKRIVVWLLAVLMMVPLACGTKTGQADGEETNTAGSETDGGSSAEEKADFQWESADCRHGSPKSEESGGEE